MSGDAPANEDATFARLNTEVIGPGLCTHCGTCVGLSRGGLEMRETSGGPLPSSLQSAEIALPASAFDSCPGKGLNYPELCDQVFQRQPENWLMGCWRKVYVGFSQVPEIRRAAASGGIITQVLIHLMENGLVDGAVVVRQGQPRPWQAEPIIATTVEEIIECSQSVYVPVPVNTILPRLEEFNGRVAYVGLPDHVASLRRLQQLGHRGVLKVDYVVGPYTGMGMYFGAIESFLRSNHVTSLEEVTELRYREGAWPGYLQIRTRSGKTLRTKKFYYNYLIPFYVTRSTLMSVDFTNELTDISVGDAWHPRYEKQDQGFSVIVARSRKGEEVLASMQDQGTVSLEECTLQEALSMHGHMLDFKKRGAFIRGGWRRAMGRPAPDYGYSPKQISFNRKLVEIAISLIFVVGGTGIARRLVELVPIAVLGPTFDALRKGWRGFSKPAKRAGLSDFQVDTWTGAKAATRPGRRP